MEPPPFTKPRPRFLPYVPLAAIVAQVLWFIFLFCAFIFTIGDTRFENTPEKGRMADLLCSPPSVLGFFAGIAIMLLSWPQTKSGRLSLIIGTIICGFLTACFINGLFN